MNKTDKYFILQTKLHIVIVVKNSFLRDIIDFRDSINDDFYVPYLMGKSIGLKWGYNLEGDESIVKDVVRRFCNENKIYDVRYGYSSKLEFEGCGINYVGYVGFIKNSLEYYLKNSKINDILLEDKYETYEVM